MITTINEFKSILEIKQKNAGIDLCIINVVDQNKSYFRPDYINLINKKCKDYLRVFQINDLNLISDNDYVFPNQVGNYTIDTNSTLDINTAEQFFKRELWPVIKQQIVNIPNEGDKYETINGEYWIWINVISKWFLCPKHIVNLCKSFVTQEREIILLGGPKTELLQSILTTFQSLHVKVNIEPKLIYSLDSKD